MPTLHADPDMQPSREDYRRLITLCSLPAPMVSLLYSLLMYAAAPIAFAVTAWRGFRDPAYRDPQQNNRLFERFGFTQLSFATRPVWVHAVSVGEVQAAAALVRALRKRYPHYPIVMTTATVTGAQRVRALFGKDVAHCYLPYDLPGSVRRFLQRIQPRIAIVLETEVWPNLYRACRRRRIPIVLASARLSEKSLRRYRRFSGLFDDAVRDLSIGAQTNTDAERFVAAGADAAHTQVTGNIKFDMDVPASLRAEGEALRNSAFAGRAVWVAGSTHAGEEDMVLEAHRRLQQVHGNALLILVPRHPNRFDEVRNWLSARAVRFVSRSKQEQVTSTVDVLLVDTLGELLLFYAASDIAFVGGTLVPIGGHNLLEPAALARPVLTGPHNFNGPDIARLLLANDAALQVRSADELATALIELFSHPARRDEIGQKAFGIVTTNRGALERVMRLIEKRMVNGE